MIIKVCGMREPENIRAIEQAGADWMGFIFFPQSARYEMCIRDSPADTYYVIGSTVGPHPYPDMVARLQSVISEAVSYTHLDVYKRQPHSPMPRMHDADNGFRNYG